MPVRRVLAYCKIAMRRKCIEWTDQLIRVRLPLGSCKVKGRGDETDQES